MKILVNLLISTVAILVATYVVQGVHVDSFFVALVVAVVLGLVNATIGTLLKILTLPISVMTLGLFCLVINAFMVMLTSWLVEGFQVDGFITALIFSIILSLISWFLFKLMPDKK